jgi:hypothetical protein
MKSILFVQYCLITLLSLLFLASCDTAPSQPLSPITTLSSDALVDLSIVIGQTVFVPAYSEIFYGSADDLLELTATLAIHNSDPVNSILVTSVQYFDTVGRLVRDFVTAPVELRSMATTGFVIGSSDTSAGWGANFLVEWGAENPVYEPVIEAVMVSRRGTEGVSFISPGRVVSEESP